MLKRLLVIALATVGLLVLPAAASAGCQATSAGSAVYVDGSQRMISGITCTTVTGDTYEIRTYLQGSYPGWHSVHVPTPFQRTVTPNNTNYQALWTYYESCSYLTVFDNYVRIKTVVENLRTGSTDIAFSGPNTNPDICQ